ncbi:MAG: signal recognition particle receptor subunit alpha, partial [Vibrio metschnikovii]
MTEKKKRGLLSWLGFGDEQPNTTTVVEEKESQSITEAERTALDTSILPVEQETASPDAFSETETETEQIPPRIQEQEKPSESFFVRLKRSLSRTKANIGAGFFGLFQGKKIDDQLFEELEEQLLMADVGMETTVKIITSLTEKASRQQLRDGEALYALLKQEMAEMLAKVEKPLQIDSQTMPYVILMVGVNGVGKTTTIGKLAKQFQAQGKKVMLAAGDTFRAAAVEQLQVWGE